MEQKHQDDLAKVLIFSGDSHVTEYDASRLKNEIKFTNILQNITTLLEAQRPELPTYNLQKPKNYSHFHVDLKNVKSVLLKNKSNDKYAVILYRDNTIKNNYRFNFLQLQNKMATVCRLNKSAKKVKNEDHTSIKIYTNKKYLNNVSSKRKTPHNIRNNTNSEYKLKKILQKQLQNEKNKHFCANAIFYLKKIHQKVILSREIENGNDIQKFVKNVRHFNNSSIVKWRQKMVKKLTSLNIELRKILIIIQINNFTSKMYLNMGKQTPKFKNAHKINNTHFVNIKMLNIKLQNVKKIDRKVNKKAKSDLSPILSETDLVAKHNTGDLTDELKGATFKEMCKILLKLQSKSRVECKKLYSHYSAFKLIAFNEEIFEIVHKIVCKFSSITRAQQNANIELVNLGYSLRNAVRSFEKEQSPAIKSIILKKLEHSIKEDDIFDPRILFPSDYKSITTIISKESICVQTDDEIIPQKKTIMNDFEVQFNIDLVQSIDTENGVFTTCTQTSENSLNIIEQISSSISTQTAISINKSAANEYSREEVQLRKNLFIHKIKNSLNQVKDMYEANSKIIKQIAESAAINKLTQERMKKNEAPINNIKKNEEVVNHLETKVEPEKNVVDEAKAQNDEIVVENMKKKVDIVRIKVEDLKRQVGTPDFVFDKRKKEDKPLVEAEVTVNDVKNKELIIQIKNTLNFVTEKFKQNSLIIAEAASIKKEYNVPKNADKNIKQPLKNKDSSSSFKQVLRQLNGSKHVIIKHSQSKIKKKLSKKVTTVMQILKKLNEVMKRMKIQPKESNRKLMEIKQTLIAQLKNLTTENQSMNKFKYSKENITLAPIRNHIHNNKNMVSLNAIRAVSNINSQQLSLSHTYPQTTPSMANIPVEYLPKSRAVGNEAMLHRIMPNVRSKHILKFRDTRDKKKQLYATFGVQNNNKIANAPVVYTRKENPLIAKIVRPIRNTNVEEFLPKLSELSISCVQRFKTEYPRKDHLNIISPAVKESYLSKLLTSEIGCNSILEPLVKCSSKECDQCVANSLNIENKKPSTAPPRSRKDNSFQNNKNFNFKQFMHDPTLKHNVNYTVCPVDVTYNKNPVKNRTQTTTKKSSTTSQSKSTKMNPLSLKNKFNSEENQIQRSIQQAILKNQEKFMLLHAFITDRNSAAKNIAKTSKTSNVVNITPKVSTPLAANKKINTNSKSKQDSKLKNNKKPMNKNKTISPNKNVSSADFFDKKYGNKTSLSSMESNEITPKHEYTQGELQNYIAQVEKKFINTFSMKDEEKANAYNNLTLEIEDMLDVLKASGAKETEKESDTSESTINTLSQKEQIVNNFLTQPKCLISTYSNPTKSTSTLSEPSKHAIEWDKSGAKKKNNKNSGPTIITDHINFKQSLTAIQSKEASLFHVHSTSNCQFIDHVPIIRNCKSDTKIFRPKKIRVNLPSLKIDESEDSLLTSITEEEELSMCNDVTSNESSANTLSFPEIVTELLVEVHFKIVVHFSYICQIAKVTYLVTVWQNVDIELPQEKDTINTRPMTAAYKAKYDIDKFDKISDKDLSIEGESSWDSFESETLRSNKSKDILYLPDSKFEIDVDFIDKYYSSLKLKDLFPDGDQSDEPDEVVIPSTSPKILEFLDMLTSLTKDDDILPMEIKQNIYYKYNYNKPLISYFCYTYHQINIFEQVSFKMTNQIRFNQGYSSALNFQSNQLRRLIDENQNQRKFKDVRMPRFISVPNCNLYSIATINSDRKFPNTPRLLDANKCFSDTKLNFEFDDKFVKKRKTDSLSQSMFLNSQVSKKKRKINRLMKIAKRAVVNQSAPLLKQNSKLNQNFTYNLSAVNITDISDSLKLVLIFLYVTVFAFVFFCITLNYSCE